MLAEVKITPSSPHGPDLTVDEALASARAIVNLFSKWGLTDDQARQILGGMTQRTWARWKQGDIGRIDRDLATIRAADIYLAGMFKEHTNGSRPRMTSSGGALLWT
jgi:hypothetical protein